ncbi:MAG TPA: DUF2225 domain-containing protein [bacterium]|nr:DUF2225 domain-containing protein [bacterium]
MSEALWNYKIKCPFCGTQFETTRMRNSAIRIKEQETDFSNIFESDCPYLYAVTVCPTCTFAAKNTDFEKIRVQAEAKIMAASKQLRVSTKPKPDIFGLGPSTPEIAVKRYELVIAFYKMRYVVELGVLANLYLQLVWLYRLMKNKEKEQLALAQAATAYENYLGKAYTLPESLGEPGVIYLIGDMYRRMEKYKEACRLFEQALASKEIKDYPKIADMIRDMMMMTKEKLQKASEATSG